MCKKVRKHINVKGRIQMKKLSILCLIMAFVLVVPGFFGCSKATPVQATVNIFFRVPKDETLTDKDIAAKIKDGAKEEDLYENVFEYEVTVEGTTEDMPTVLKAAEQSLTKFEKDYELSKDGTYIAGAFDRTQVDRVDAENGYYSYWACTINGEASKDGRQSVTNIYQDDVIVFTWTSSSEPRQDTGAAETTDPNEDVTSEIPTDETTAEEEEEEEDNA